MKSQSSRTSAAAVTVAGSALFLVAVMLRLSGLPKMKSVSFWAGDVSAAALTALVDLPALARLDISNTKLGDDAAAIISRMERIEQLSVSSHFTRRGLEQLQRLPHLRILHLYRRRDANWSEKDARRLLPLVREMTVFDVY